MSDRKVPGSFECPSEGCGRKFANEDLMQQHLTRRHQGTQPHPIKNEAINQNNELKIQPKMIPQKQESKSDDNCVQEKQQIQMKQTRPPTPKQKPITLEGQSENNGTTNTPSQKVQMPIMTKVISQSSFSIQQPPIAQNMKQIILKKDDHSMQITSSNQNCTDSIKIQSRRSTSKEIKQRRSLSKENTFQTHDPQSIIDSIPNGNANQKRENQIAQTRPQTAMVTSNTRPQSAQSDFLMESILLCLKEVDSQTNEVQQQAKCPTTKIMENESSIIQSEETDSISEAGSEHYSISSENRVPSIKIEEILACKRRITSQYLLQNGTGEAREGSDNAVDDISLIETLCLNQQDLIVFEDGTTDVRFELMLSLASLSLSKNRLFSVSALGKFASSLIELNLNFNSIRDLSPLSECILIEKLSASHNKIESIACLFPLKNLKQISLFSNQIKEIEMKSILNILQGCTQLNSLDLAQNQISNMPNYKMVFLSRLTQLKMFDASQVTPSDSAAARIFAQNQLNSEKKQLRPGTAPQKVFPKPQSLAASMIVNQQIEKQQSQLEKTTVNKKPTVLKDDSEQKSNQLLEIQERQGKLKELIRLAKRDNKTIQNAVEAKEQEIRVLREQHSQIEAIRESNSQLLRKVAAYESTLILHSETPEELKAHLKYLNNEVNSLTEKNKSLIERNQDLREMSLSQSEKKIDNKIEEDEYDPSQLNDLLMRSTAAFSQIKKDLKQLHNPSYY